MRDYLSDTTKTLMEQRRVKEAVDFCQRIIEESPSVERKCIAMRDLAEIHFFITGDGMEAKAANIAGLALLDENRELVFRSELVAPGVMQRVYSDLCEQARALAVSFEEYELYAHKSEEAGVRKLNQTEKRGLKAVAQMRRENVPWVENLFNQVGDYAGHQAFGQMVSLLGVILENRRSLRLNRMDLNEHVLPGVAKGALNLVAEHINTCLSKGQKPVVENYAFMVDKGIQLLEDCRKDRNADPNVITSLVEMMREEFAVMEGTMKNNFGGEPPTPTAEQIAQELPSEIAASGIGKVLGPVSGDFPEADERQERESFCEHPPRQELNPFSAFEIIVTLLVMVSLWYWGLHDGLNWLGVILAAFVSFVLVPFGVVLAMRWQRRR